MLVLHAIGKCLIRKQSSAINCEVHAVVLQTILSKNVPKQTRDTNKTLWIHVLKKGDDITEQELCS